MIQLELKLATSKMLLYVTACGGTYFEFEHFFEYLSVNAE